MARADLLCDLIKSGSIGDNIGFRKAAEAICAEERAKQHEVLARKIEEILRTMVYNEPRREPPAPSQRFSLGGNDKNMFFEKIPERRLDQLFYQMLLSNHVVNSLRNKCAQTYCVPTD